MEEIIMLLLPIDNTFHVNTINHNSLLNTHNLTTDINHDALTNFVSNEHIDWTDASQNFKTSGSVQCNKLFPNVAPWRIDVYSDSTLSLGSGMEFYSAYAPFNKGNFNFIANYAAGVTTGKSLFLATPDGLNFYTNGAIMPLGDYSK